MEFRQYFRGRNFVNLALKIASCSSCNKDSRAIKDDLDSSCSEQYDSDDNNEYVPESETSSDSDEQSAAKGRPMSEKLKVRNKRIVDLPEGNETSVTINFNDLLLENNLDITIDESNLDTPLMVPIGQEENRAVIDNENNGSVKKRKVKYKILIKQIGKKRVRHQDDWQCNVRKRKLSAGEEYINNKGKMVLAKTMKPFCSCKMKCNENSYWCENSNIDAKMQFISSCVACQPIIRSRKRGFDSKKGKENTLLYFTVDKRKVRVCKT